MLALDRIPEGRKSPEGALTPMIPSGDERVYPPALREEDDEGAAGADRFDPLRPSVEKKLPRWIEDGFEAVEALERVL
jgi:hypothetical protein